MSAPDRPRRIALAAALALTLPLATGLGGCISLFPKATPVQLYRLTPTLAPPASPAPAGLAVVRDHLAFTTQSSGDRILTVSGAEVAFVGGSRWLEPASLMFDEAVSEVFDQPGAPQLRSFGGPAGAATTLRLEVRRFEVDYAGGLNTTPTIVVQLRATLMRNSDRSEVGEKLFESRHPAADNRVGAIVDAFGAASGDVLSQLRDWTTAEATGASS